MSPFCCLGRTNVSVQARDIYIYICFITRPDFTVSSFFSTSPNSQAGGITPCRQYTTAYSIYSQLPSLLEGPSCIRNLRTRHAMVAGTHLPCTVIVCAEMVSVKYYFRNEHVCHRPSYGEPVPQ